MPPCRLLESYANIVIAALLGLYNDLELLKGFKQGVHDVVFLIHLASHNRSSVSV